MRRFLAELAVLCAMVLLVWVAMLALTPSPLTR